MPITYDYSRNSHRISCSRCGEARHTDAPYDGDALAADGSPLRDTFRWIAGTRQAYHPFCRACERAANAERRARQPRRPRVPAMTSRAALGTARKFGVEFECAFPGVTGDVIAQALRDAGIPAVHYESMRRPGDWLVKGDPSIQGFAAGYNGREIVSPALTGDDGEQQVRTVCRVLRSLGGKVNRTCGTHVHHDVNDLTVADIKRTYRSWFNSQPLISGLVSQSRRAGGTFYCRPVTSSDVTRVEQIRDRRGMRSVSVDRYRSLNITSYGKHGTLEVRQHQGTLDAEKVISWVRLGQALIDSAKVAEEPLPQRATLREHFADLGDRLNETARTFLLGRAVEFNAVQV